MLCLHLCLIPGHLLSFCLFGDTGSLMYGKTLLAVEKTVTAYKITGESEIC
jgi:hypothetical protein